MEINWTIRGLIMYIGWSKYICAPNNCTVICRCPETFWSLCIAVQYEMERLSIKWPGGEWNIGRWVLETWRDLQTGCVVQLQTYPMDISSGVRRGRWGVQLHPPNSEGLPQSFKKHRFSKLLIIAEFRMPTPQDVWKKGIKILKLPRFAIVLH